MPKASAPQLGVQLALLAAEEGRDDHVDVIVCDSWGRILDVIPTHLGDRREHRDRASLHEATLWAVVAVANAAERLPPPAWATLPGHDACARRQPP